MKICWKFTTAWVHPHIFRAIMENSGPASPKLGDRDLARPGAVDFVEYPSYHLQQGGNDVMMEIWNVYLIHHVYILKFGKIRDIFSQAGGHI